MQQGLEQRLRSPRLAAELNKLIENTPESVARSHAAKLGGIRKRRGGVAKRNPPPAAATLPPLRLSPPARQPRLRRPLLTRGRISRAAHHRRVHALTTNVTTIQARPDPFFPPLPRRRLTHHLSLVYSHVFALKFSALQSTVREPPLLSPARTWRLVRAETAVGPGGAPLSQPFRPPFVIDYFLAGILRRFAGPPEPPPRGGVAASRNRSRGPREGRATQPTRSTGAGGGEESLPCRSHVVTLALRWREGARSAPLLAVGGGHVGVLRAPHEVSSVLQRWASVGHP